MQCLQFGQCRLRVADGKVACAAHRRVAGQQFIGIGQTGRLGIVPSGELVNQACGHCSRCTQVLAAEHQLSSGFCAHQARRALRAAGAGKQPQIDLGQTQLGRRQRHAVVGRHGNLQAPAKRCAMDGGNHRFAALFNALANLGQRRRLGRLAKLADVRARNERFASAHQQHGGNSIVGLRSRNGSSQTLADRHAQRIHRGVGNGHHQHTTLAGSGDNGIGGCSAHAGSPSG